MRAAFDTAHEDRYGYADRGAELELVTVRVAAALQGETVEPSGAGGGMSDIEGPAVVPLDGTTTVVVPAGWRADAWRHGPDPGAPPVNAIELQVMLGALRAACDEMGVVLVRSAHSANIKERRDASTALFDAAGRMAMQAEHIPVHLGAMPSAVAAVLGEDHAPGDAWILNDPFAGGTHLPDITVVSPVFAGDDLIGFAASRAHHADVGGAEPGSRCRPTRGRSRRRGS